jgi:putative serine protease PepD
MSPPRILPGLLLFFLFFPASKGAALTPDEQNTVDIYKRVNASVVNITSIAVTYDFFLNPIPSEASGSGSVIDNKGYILTNNHVVKDAQRLEVTLSDGSRWPARLVGADPQTDLAVIQIKVPPERLTVATIGDSGELFPGQKVIAIGNPFGLERTLTTGIISSVRKTLKTGDIEMEDVIQTDAAINPGNSGGPLLDSDGKVIGINTAIFSPSGANIGIGFAIPVNTAKRILDELIAKGYVSYAWMGIDLQSLIPEFSKALDLPVGRGALVARVARRGPAGRAGIRGGNEEVVIGNTILIVGGDIIVAADGENVESSEAFYRILKRKKPGETLQVDLYRNGEKKAVNVRLEERPRR